MSKLLRYPDIVAAVAGLVVMATSSVILVCKEFHPVYLVAVGVGLGSIGLYLILRRRETREGDLGNDRTVSWIFIAGSLLLCLSAWLAFVLRSEQYIKPTAYYVLMACATSLAFYGVLKSEGKIQPWIVVGIACIIGLSHIWTEHLLFPGSLIGLDPWIHQAITAGQPSFLSIGSGYSLMHIYLKSVMGLLDISYKWASLIFVGSFQTAGIVLFTFLIGRILWNTKVGCVAGLMAASANWVVFFGGWIIPNATGATYGLVVAYLVLKMSKGSTKWLLVPIALIVLTAYATHLIAAVWVLGTFACLWVLPTLFNKTLSVKAKTKKTGELSVIPLLGVLVVAMLFYFTPADDALRYTTENGPVPIHGTIYVVEQTSETVFEYKGGSTLSEMVVDSVGMFLYFGLAVLGCLIMLRRTTAPIQKTFVVLGLATLSIGFFPLLFDFPVLEHRWWYFAEVLLAIPLGVAIVSLASTGYRWAVSVTMLVVVITFLSAIGLVSNMTNRTLSPNLIARYAFTEDEMGSLAIVQEYNHRIIGTDPVFYPPATMGVDNAKVISLTDEILSGDFSAQRANILLLRDALHEEPFAFGNGAIYRLNCDLVELAKQQGYREIWKNDEVHILMKEGLE